VEDRNWMERTNTSEGKIKILRIFIRGDGIGEI
jgi:hypothetical protein